MKGLEKIAVLLYKTDHKIFAATFTVYLYPFAEIHQMGRGVEAYFVAGGLKDGGYGVRHRPLAVGAAYMDGGVAAVRVTQMLVKGKTGAKALFICTNPDLFKDRGAVV